MTTVLLALPPRRVNIISTFNDTVNDKIQIILYTTLNQLLLILVNGFPY